MKYIIGVCIFKYLYIKSHSENPVLGIRDLLIERDHQAQPKHLARVFRHDDAIVPQTGTGIIGMALFVVFLNNIISDGFFLFIGPSLIFFQGTCFDHLGKNLNV